MPAPSDRPTAGGPFGWLFAPLDEWSRLLSVAQELRNIDCERMETMLETCASGPDPLSPEEVIQVRSLVQLLKSLQLDPEAIHLERPETMRKLEAACIDCTKRSRCDHELAAGTAATTYPEFCPNTPDLKALVSVSKSLAKVASEAT